MVRLLSDFRLAGIGPNVKGLGPRLTICVVADCNTRDPPPPLLPVPPLEVARFTMVATTPVASAEPLFSIVIEIGYL